MLINLIGVLFLIATLVVGTKITNDRSMSLNISSKAADCFNECRQDSGRKKCNSQCGVNVNWKGENVVDTSNVDKKADPKDPTCDANGVQYSPGAVVMYGGIGSNATCGSDGKWDVGVGATIDIKPENVPEYAKGTDELKKAIEDEQQAVAKAAQELAQQELKNQQIEEIIIPQQNPVQQKEQQTAEQQTTSTTSTNLEKTDEGFIRTTTTIVRDATGKVVDTKSISTTAKTTSTFTQIGADLIRTDTTVTTDLATGKVVDTAKSQTTLKNSVAQPTTSITVNQQGTVSIKQPAGSVCTFSSDCESGGCGIGGERGGITKTCQTSPDPQPQTNTQATAQETFNTLNTLTFGGFGNYAQSFAPDKVEYYWQTNNYDSLEDCENNFVGRGKGYCSQIQYTKEQVTSSINLGTTLTAEGAALMAVPATLTAGSLGGGFMTGLTALGGITTLNQTGNAAVAQIEDPGSAEAWKQTGLAALSWANLGTADYLMKTFANTASTAQAINNARRLNTAVSLINLGVDAPTAYTACSQEGLLTGSCGGAIAAVVADIGFGTLDMFQGQTIFRNVPRVDTPSPAGVIDALTPPKLDVPIAKTTNENLDIITRNIEQETNAANLTANTQTDMLFAPTLDNLPNTPARVIMDDLSRPLPEVEIPITKPINPLANVSTENLEPKVFDATKGNMPPTTEIKIPQKFTNWWDEKVTKPVGDFVFGNPIPKTLDTANIPNPEKSLVQKLFSGELFAPKLSATEIPAQPEMIANAPAIIPADVPTVKVPYSKELDPLVVIKNAYNKSGARVAEDLTTNNIDDLLALARENGYEPKFVPIGQGVNVISEGGKPVVQPLSAVNPVRIGSDGRTLYIGLNPNNSKTLYASAKDIAHDLGAILMGGKVGPAGTEAILPETLANFLEQATGNKYTAEQVIKMFGEKDGQIQTTWIMDEFIKGKVPAKILDSVPDKPPTFIEKYLRDDRGWLPWLRTPTKPVVSEVPIVKVETVGNLENQPVLLTNNGLAAQGQNTNNNIIVNPLKDEWLGETSNIIAKSNRGTSEPNFFGNASEQIETMYPNTATNNDRVIRNSLFYSDQPDGHRVGDVVLCGSYPLCFEKNAVLHSAGAIEGYESEIVSAFPLKNGPGHTWLEYTDGTGDWVVDPIHFNDATVIEKEIAYNYYKSQLGLDIDNLRLAQYVVPNPKYNPQSVEKVASIKQDVKLANNITAPPLTGLAKFQEQVGGFGRKVMEGSFSTGVGLSPLKYVAGGIASAVFLDDYFDLGIGDKIISLFSTPEITTKEQTPINIKLTPDVSTSITTTVAEQPQIETNTQLELVKSGLYAQTDPNIASTLIPGGAGKPFKNIGCGQTTVANILCEYSSTCPTPIEVANMIPLNEYDGGGLTSTQSNIKILNKYGFTADPYRKSLEYHLTEYMEPDDILWISANVGGIAHHTYLDGYSIDSSGTPTYNLNDSYFGDGFKCKTTSGSSFGCVNDDGTQINIAAENANIYIIDTN